MSEDWRSWPVEDKERLLRRLQLEKARRDFPTPGHLARYLERRTVQTPALDLLDAALVDTTPTTDADGTVRRAKAPRLMWTMPPQEGKSVRISRFFALWLLIHDPDRRIAIVSYGDALARRWGRAIRNDIRRHPELGLLVRTDSSASNEWELADGWIGGVITAGIESGLTGRPADVLIVDDPLKGQKEADSEVYREGCKEFWRTTASSRLSETAIVVFVMTRWHEDDLVGWLQREQTARWRLVNIPAQAEHDPDKAANGGCGCAGGQGQCLGGDILGRKVGDYMVSARNRSREGWELRKADAGSRGWAALYQGHPAPEEGGILKRGWWKYFRQARAVLRADGTMFAIGADTVLISLDAAFKDTDQSDYVVFGVWAKRGAEMWLLDIVRDRMDFPTTIEALRQLAAKWPQAATKLIEDKANGPAVVATLGKEIPGITPFSPTDSKLARAYSVSPFVEAGNVWLPDPSISPFVNDFVNECAAFPNGTNDDQVDMFTQAAIRFYLLSGSASDFMQQLEAERRTPPAVSTDPDAERGDPVRAGGSYWSTR